MAVCDGCGVLGWTVPLFTRPILVNAQPCYLIICGTCKALADAALVRKIELWESPFGGSIEEEDEMRGLRAKALRRQIYGEGMSSRMREWSSADAPKVWGIRLKDRIGQEIGIALRRLWTTRVTADPLRRAYQHLKQSRRGMSPEEARRSA
ncbi:MAG: hypothetical protein Q8N00_11340 [Nitrospirota bacterium]|nr:hypothetical protein [Nitrospirota bacterium]MDP3596171.1 hypothetical protein [Nitrospirota bacterium]